MNKLINAVLIIGVLIFAGCSDDYFADGANMPENQSGQLNMSTMEYLESQPQTFDTLTTLIRLTGLEAAVNAEGNTFFAPRDYSIHNFFELIFPDPETRPATLEDIPEGYLETIKIILQDYIITGTTVTRATLATSYSYANTYSGRKARFNVVQQDYLGNVNMGAKTMVFSLNMSLEDDREAYQSAPVATSDLRSTNGIVHILDSNQHILGFN